MSSPTKFRVWDGEKMHLPPHRFVRDGEGALYVLRCDVGSCDKVCVQLSRVANSDAQDMDYTGLDDAEGTPIYEGDVVRLGTDRDAGYSRLALVVWEAPMFVYSPIQGYTSHWGLNANMDAKPLFVVGNRFEDAYALNDPEDRHGLD